MSDKIDPHDFMDEYDEWENEDRSLLDIEMGAIYICSLRKDEFYIKYVPGQWNDSGVDPPHYVVQYGKYWACLEFDHIRIGAPFLGNKSLKIDHPMKLKDFVNIVSSPFPLELAEGAMGKYFEDEYNLKDIVIEVDLEHVKNQFERFNDLKVFL